MMIGVVKHDGDKHKAGGMVVQLKLQKPQRSTYRTVTEGLVDLGVVFIIVVFCFFRSSY